MKTDLFQSCGHCWVFQICWHIECSTFTASSFRILNSSTGIPSPPLALFIVMLSKAHLTSHSRMSGSRWVITPSWLSGLWRSFLYSSSVCSCHLFLISSASLSFMPFLLFIVLIFAWNVPLLLLLLSHFNRVRLCVTPWTAAHQAPPSLGFSRQEHWSGLPFPFPMHESEKWKWSHSAMSKSSRPRGLQPTKLLCPWDFPGKSTGVGCHCLLPWPASRP